MFLKFERPKLVPRQWKLMANAISNISQAIILFSLAAIFAPEVVNLSTQYPRLIAATYLIAGILLLVWSSIIMKRGSN